MAQITVSFDSNDAEAVEALAQLLGLSGLGKKVTVEKNGKKSAKEDDEPTPQKDDDDDEQTPQKSKRGSKKESAPAKSKKSVKEEEEEEQAEDFDDVMEEVKELLAQKVSGNKENRAKVREFLEEHDLDSYAYIEDLELLLKFKKFVSKLKNNG